MKPMQLINYSKLVDKIEWDNDIHKWTIYDDKLEDLVFSTEDACGQCYNNPKNGGSGVCNCILGTTPVC